MNLTKFIGLQDKTGVQHVVNKDYIISITSENDGYLASIVLNDGRTLSVNAYRDFRVSNSEWVSGTMCGDQFFDRILGILLFY